MNIIQSIDSLESELKRKKETLNHIVSLIKKDRNDSYFKYEAQPFTNFRFALSIIIESFIKKYDFNENTYKLEMAKTWKTNEYLNYYNVFKSYSKGSYGQKENYRINGFICNKKDLFYAIKDKITDMWLFQVNHERYKDSLENYTKELKKLNPNDLFNAYHNYLNDYHHKKEYKEFYVLNMKSIGLNNIVVFLKD